MEYRTYNITLPECDYREDFDYNTLEPDTHYTFDDYYGRIIIDDDAIWDLIAEDCGRAINAEEFVIEDCVIDEHTPYPDMGYDCVTATLKGHYEVNGVTLPTEESYLSDPENEGYDYFDYVNHVLDIVTDMLDEKYKSKYYYGFEWIAYDRFDDEGRLDDFYNGVLIEEVK